MKRLLIPIFISIFIIPQIIPVNLFATTSEEDCMALLSDSSENSELDISDECMDLIFWDSESTTWETISSESISLESISLETDDIQSNIEEINNTITDWVTMDSAPTKEPIVYSSWELVHRIPIMAWFVWTWVIANYIRPAMYIGTDYENKTNLEYTNTHEVELIQTNILTENIDPFNSFLVEEPTNYNECVKHEAYLSFGLGDSVENKDIKELKAIAKSCAKEYYGSYFNGKSYTTREEFLMLLFTLFNEQDVGIPWTFTEDGKYIKNPDHESETGYKNVDPKSWYASYLKLASYLGIVENENGVWQIAKAISDQEAIEILSLYTAQHMDYQGETLDRGIIITDSNQYIITFLNKSEVSIEIQ